MHSYGVAMRPVALIKRKSATKNISMLYAMLSFISSNNEGHGGGGGGGGCDKEEEVGLEVMVAALWMLSSGILSVDCPLVSNGWGANCKLVSYRRLEWS